MLHPALSEASCCAQALAATAEALVQMQVQLASQALHAALHAVLGRPCPSAEVGTPLGPRRARGAGVLAPQSCVASESREVLS